METQQAQLTSRQKQNAKDSFEDNARQPGSAAIHICWRSSVSHILEASLSLF